MVLCKRDVGMMSEGRKTLRAKLARKEYPLSAWALRNLS